MPDTDVVGGRENDVTLSDSGRSYAHYPEDPYVIRRIVFVILFLLIDSAIITWIAMQFEPYYFGLGFVLKLICIMGLVFMVLGPFQILCFKKCT